MPYVRTGASPERLALAEQAAKLRTRGLTQVKIAERLGISRSYVSELLRDPEGHLARERKDSYGGACIDCGARTNGNDGRNKTPERCAACRAEYEFAGRMWTPEAIIAAIQRWAREHGGAPPRASDWARRPPDWAPYLSQVYYQNKPGKRRNPFRYWADAIEAAGFPRPRTGHYDRSRTLGLGAVERDILALAEDGPVTAPWLHHEIGLQRTTARHALKSLHRRGLLTRDEKREGRTYVYRHATPQDT